MLGEGNEACAYKNVRKAEKITVFIFVFLQGFVGKRVLYGGLGR